ncbi:MAG: hypothetical protein HY741_18145 [Chloroflexi bacterium]|nr:hypothetical protein [Chloroflexota bacterium]
MLNSRVLFILAILFLGILAACANVTPAPLMPTPQPAVTQPTAAPPTTAPLPTKPAPTNAQPVPTDNPPAVNLPPFDPALAQKIAGKYAKELSDQELSDAGVGRNDRLFLKAKWELELTPDGRAIFWQDTGSFKSVVMEAPFSLSGDTLLLGTDKGDYGCFNLGVMEGKYQWKLAGNELTFTTIQDECPRHFLMTIKPWIKVGAVSGKGGVTPPLRTAPTVIAQRSDKEWTYVSMGDGFQVAGPVTQIFAEYLEQDLGVKVKHKHWGTFGKPRLVIQVRDDANLRQALQEAEVITLNWQPAVLDAPAAWYKDGTCGGADNEDCWRTTVAAAQADWDALLDEITKLKSPRDALFRTYYFGSWPLYAYYDYYGGSVGDAQLEVEIRYMRAMDEYTTKSAAARGIPAVNLFELFQNSDPHKKAPAEYFSDKLHLNKQGSKVVADGLRALGYGYAAQAALSSSIAGTYGAEFTAQELMAAGFGFQGAYHGMGKWTLELKSSGEVAYWLDQGDFLSLMFEGEYRLAGDTISFGKEKGWAGFAGCTERGYGDRIYRWQMQNDGLTFARVDDECDPQNILTVKPWQKVDPAALKFVAQTPEAKPIDYRFTFENDRCKLESSPQSASTPIRVRVAVTNSTDKNYQVIILTLKPNATRAELEAWTQDALPPMVERTVLFLNPRRNRQEVWVVPLEAGQENYFLCAQDRKILSAPLVLQAPK